MKDPDWMAKNWCLSYNMMPRVEKLDSGYKLNQEEAREIAVSYVLNNYLTLEKPEPLQVRRADLPQVGQLEAKPDRRSLRRRQPGGRQLDHDGPDGPAHGGAGRPAGNNTCGSRANGASRRSDRVAWASAATRTTATARALRSTSIAR